MALSGVELRTVKACGEDWGAMQGGGRARFCAACEKTVHDVAKMSPREVERLALRAVMGEEVCARLTRRSDGELVTLEARGGRVVGTAAGVVMAAAVAVGSAAAQETKPLAVEEDYPPCEPLLANPPGTANYGVVHGCWKLQPPATVTGRVLRPDGSPVSGGLLLVRGERGETLYVLDEIGTFEIHEEPGTYQLMLQTKADEARRIGGVKLHEGYQSFGDVKMLAGQDGLVTDEINVTMGAMVSTVSRMPWWAPFRHPVGYARYVGRRLRRNFGE